MLVEYTMLSGVNDTLEDAQRLVQLLEGVEAKVRWSSCFQGLQELGIALPVGFVGKAA